MINQYLNLHQADFTPGQTKAYLLGFHDACEAFRAVAAYVEGDESEAVERCEPQDELDLRGRNLDFDSVLGATMVAEAQGKKPSRLVISSAQEETLLDEWKAGYGSIRSTRPPPKSIDRLWGFPVRVTP